MNRMVLACILEQVAANIPSRNRLIRVEECLRVKKRTLLFTLRVLQSQFNI